MGMEHPEMSGGDHHMEATVGEQIRLGKFLASLDSMSAEELRELCRIMGKQVLVVYPSAIRYLAHEAARNLGGAPWDREKGDELVELLLQRRE